MTTGPAFEAFLARIYSDAESRARFLEDPVREATRSGLSDEETRALTLIDRTGLEMAAASFAHKSEKAAPMRKRHRWF